MRGKSSAILFSLFVHQLHPPSEPEIGGGGEDKGGKKETHFTPYAAGFSSFLPFLLGPKNIPPPDFPITVAVSADRGDHEPKPSSPPQPKKRQSTFLPQTSPCIKDTKGEQTLLGQSKCMHTTGCLRDNCITKRHGHQDY